MTEIIRPEISRGDFVAIDFETSGFNFRNECIIEACVIRVRNWETVSIYNTMVALPVGKELNPVITEVTGHTYHDIMQGIHQETLAQVLRSLIEPDDIIVAHNAMFDMSFLDSLFVLWFGSEFTVENPFLDTLTVSRERSKYPHKLGDMCQKYGVPLDDAHSAYSDTMALVDLVWRFREEDESVFAHLAAGAGAPWKGKPYECLDDLVNVVGYKRKYGAPEWYPPQAILRDQTKEMLTPPPTASKPVRRLQRAGDK